MALLDDIRKDPNSLRMLTELFNTAYKKGHHDTVEGIYIDVIPPDMDTYHEGLVEDFLDDYLNM